VRIYLAARYSRREELCGYRSQLEALGHTVTSRWLNGNHQIDDKGLSVEAAQNERERFATEDFTDVLSAHVLIAFTEQPRSSNSRGGRHVELGIALGSRRMAVIVVGPRENVFCCLPSIFVCDRFEECLSVIGSGIQFPPSGLPGMPTIRSTSGPPLCHETAQNALSRTNAGGVQDDRKSQ